jgi:hypothetical protein
MLRNTQLIDKRLKAREIMETQSTVTEAARADLEEKNQYEKVGAREDPEITFLQVKPPNCCDSTCISASSWADGRQCTIF